MKIRLKKDKIIKRWESYMGLHWEVAAILNSGGIAEVDKIPDKAKDLVEIVKSEEKK